MRFTTTVAASAVAAVANAQNYLGFNSGATLADRSAKFKADFVAEFETAAKLKNAPGDFNAVRLYTNIQAYSEDAPIEAFEAAIETGTKLLLGVWASGTDNIDKEISALKKAIDAHGDDLTDLIIGAIIGSEDLYRISETGVINESGVGNSPKALVGFVDDWRQAFKNGPLADVPVGHADTWDVWGNATNKPVIDAVDFVAVHEYPYYENDKGNHIDNAGKLFDRAFQVALDAAGDKPVWLTETGWPYVGPDWDEAEASVKNAKKYWQDIGCKRLFNKMPTFWYTLRDSNPDNKMSFGITDNLSTTPRFDLSCDDVEEDEETTSTSKSSSPSSTSGSSSPTKTSGSDEDEEDTTTTDDASPTETGSSGDDDASSTFATSTFASASPTSTPGGGAGGDDNESGDDSSNDNGSGEGVSSELPTGTPTGADGPVETGAAAGLKMFSVAAYVALGVAGAMLF